jgi:hypothetical protein
MGLLAVVHFKRLKNMANAVTRVLALSLGTRARRGAEELTEQSLLDWWRLRVAVEVATSPFSAIHWLSFSCTLLGYITLCAFSGWSPSFPPRLDALLEISFEFVGSLLLMVYTRCRSACTFDE